jgi:hypothetical protein
LKKALLTLLAVGVFFSYFELPAPRYSELNDYPSVVATELETSIKLDPSLSNAGLKVLRAWGWRWGRYGARVQVWGIQNRSQQKLIEQHLKSIKSKLGTKRFIRAELWSVYPGVPPHTSTEPEKVVILGSFSS